MKHEEHNTPKVSWAHLADYLKQGKLDFPEPDPEWSYPKVPSFLKPVMDGCKELRDANKKVTQESLILMTAIMLHRMTRLGRVKRLRIPPDHGDRIRKFLKAFRANVERSKGTA